MIVSNRLNQMSSFLEDSTQKTTTHDIPTRELSPVLHIIPQLLATTIVSWLSIIVGYASAYSSPAESTMMQELNITRNEASWICSLLPVGALIGSLSGGPFLECLGRKKTLIVSDMIFLMAWSINYFSQNCWSMFVSRVLNGYSVGIASFALPVYLAETLQPTIRGRLGLFPTAFGNFGILICFICGNLFEWRGLAGVGALLTFPFLIAIWVVPETPRWFVSKRRVARARASLQWLRGDHYDVDKELKELLHLKTNDNHVKFTKSRLKIFAIVLGLMFFQQFSGINAVIFYTTQIFEKSGSSLNASICTAIIGIVNFISTFIAAAVVDKLGRKVLLYTSSTLVGSMLAILGLYFFLKVKKIDLISFQWLPLSCFVFYVLGFSFGLGPIPWLMMGEILPAAIRGPAASISAAFNWSCTFIITKTFPFFVDSVGPHYAFWFFGIVTICSLMFFKLFVPETKRRTLEDIERILANN